MFNLESFFYYYYYEHFLKTHQLTPVLTAVSDNMEVTFAFQTHNKRAFDCARGNQICVWSRTNMDWNIEICISKGKRRHYKSNIQSVLTSRSLEFTIDNTLSTVLRTVLLNKACPRVPIKRQSFQEFTASSNCKGSDWNFWKYLWLRLKSLRKFELNISVFSVINPPNPLMFLFLVVVVCLFFKK